MSRQLAARVAILLVLLLPVGFRSSAVHAERLAVSADLLSVPYDATLPESGHMRFVRSSANGQLLFVGLQDGGLERSADGGRTWNFLRVGVAGGPGAQMLDLRIAPSNPDIVWAAGLTGVYRSTDGGLTWTEVDTRSDGPGRAVGSVLAIDPRHPEAAFLAGYRNGGLYVTHDAGLSWTEALAFPVSGVAVDPTSGAIVYAVSRTAGVQRSADHGSTWSHGVRLPAYTGIGEETAAPGRLLAVSGSGAGLYAAMDGGGVERSLNGGRSWQDLSFGLPQTSPGEGYAVPYDLSVTGGSSPFLYAIVPDGSLLQPHGSALFRLPLAPSSSAGPVSTVTATPSPSATETASPSATPSPSNTNSPTIGALSSQTAMPGSPSTPISGTQVLTATAIPSSSVTSSPTTSATATPPPSATPLPTVQWQAAGLNVDAVAAAPNARTPLLAAREASPRSGMTATVGPLVGTPLLGLPYRLTAPSVRVVNGGFVLGATPLTYLSGINYEGPADRPWQLWQNGKFNPTLVAGDLDAAAAAGYKVLRIFVQDPLPAQVLLGEFGHLDTLVTLAHQRDLRLLITFNDSRDLDLTRVAAVDRAIAGHLRGNPTVFGYDLQNEPAYQDIVAAQYPSGYGIPLQSAALVRRYGEYVSLKRIRADRAAGKWLDAPFTQMSADQVWVYLNAANIVDEFFNAVPNYPDTPAPAHWQPLVAAINGSVATYISVLRGAIRSVDPIHMITIGYNKYFWASLPANSVLDFRSMHLYPTNQSFSSIHGDLQMFEALKAMAPSPLVLGEYGFSTANQAGDLASVQESAMSLYPRVLGGNGDIKWVLNDDTVGYNPYENGLGLLAAHGVPKAAYYVNRARNAYFSGRHQPGGVRMWADSTTGIGYLYSAPDALGVSGGSYSDSRLSYAAKGGSAEEVWMNWTARGTLRVVATHDANLNLNLTALADAVPGPITLSPAQPMSVKGTKVSLHLHAGTWYTLSFSPGAYELPPPPPDLPVAAQTSGWYILAAGHNILPPLLGFWQNLGSSAVVGTPIDDAQFTPGGPVQYFTAVAMQGRGNTAILLPLGLRALGGRPYPSARELPKKTKHLYFPVTGHNLRGTFLAYWRATGGLAVWGLPETEELRQGGTIVQYFANAEFVWNGSGVSLAPLGSRAWAAGARY
jgi:hypothetical protein